MMEFIGKAALSGLQQSLNEAYQRRLAEKRARQAQQPSPLQDALERAALWETIAREKAAELVKALSAKRYAEDMCSSARGGNKSASIRLRRLEPSWPR